MALQWGPALFAGKDETHSDSHKPSLSGFNGARLCSPGKTEILLLAANIRMLLQWGPALFAGKDERTSSRSYSALDRFNGARLCSPGKTLRPFACVVLDPYWLQWGPALFAGKDQTLKREHLSYTGLASMGPGFVRRERLLKSISAHNAQPKGDGGAGL